LSTLQSFCASDRKVVIPHSSDHSPLPADAVQQFFDQWKIYRKVVAADYLHHRGAYAAIGNVLRQIAQPLSFLDLGSGVTSATAAVLKCSKLRSYEAVDISGVALNLAEKKSGRFLRREKVYPERLFPACHESERILRRDFCRAFPPPFAGRG